MSDATPEVVIVNAGGTPSETPPPAAPESGAADVAALIAANEELQRLRTENARLQGEVDQLYRERATQPAQEIATPDVEATAAAVAADVAEAVAEAVAEDAAEGAADDAEAAAEDAADAADEAEDAADEITPDPGRTHPWFESLADRRERKAGRR